MFTTTTPTTTIITVGCMGIIIGTSTPDGYRQPYPGLEHLWGA